MSALPHPFCVNDPAVYCELGGASFQPQHPSLILLHGALNDHTVWARQTHALARQLAGAVNVLALDLPGHGRSAGPALASVEAMADWLLALLDTAGIDRVMLAGHSMGALIALEAASRRPARVERLALLGATWPMGVAPSLLEMAANDEPAAIALVAKWSHAAPAAAAEPGGAALVGQAVELMTRVAAGGAKLLHTDLHACQAYANGEAAAHAIACPVTLVVGTADRMTPAKSATRLHAALPHAELVQVDSGHQMMAEQPDAVLAALAGFAGAR